MNNYVLWNSAYALALDGAEIYFQINPDKFNDPEGQ